MTIKRIVLASALLTFYGLAQAQTLKAGLWETTQQILAQGEEAKRQASATAAMQKQIAAMPIKERKAFEKTLANPNDPLGFDSSLSAKICLPKGKVERGALRLEEGICSHTISPRVGNSVKFSYSCARPPNHGEGTLVVISPDAYTVTLTATATIKRQDTTVTSQTKGRWLSSDCGGVRPDPLFY